MFLKKVYRHNKLMFGGMLFFILMQLFVSYKHGMVFSPWFNYGMYSERIPIRQTYYVTYLKFPIASGISPQKWDKIHYTLSQYHTLRENDSIYRQEVSRIYPRLFFHNPDHQHFVAAVSIDVFYPWYRNYISKFLHVQAADILIDSGDYRWDGRRLTKKQTKEAMDTVNPAYQTRFVLAYVLLFYVLAVYKLWNGMWLFQLEPQFINTRFDGITWLFMQTGIHQLLLSRPVALFAFDTAFYLMPLLYLLSLKRNIKLAVWIAGLMLIVNWIYVQCYTLYPSNSIEGHAGWLLYPIVFMTTSPKSFYLMTQAMRYFLLFFISSAAVWKIVQGGLFNYEQMSGVLLFQHKEFLVAYPHHWYTEFVYTIIRHPGIGLCLYILSGVFEISFAIGFCTRKYDRVLLVLLIIFLLTDYLVMRIPYFEILPMALPLWFSRDWYNKHATQPANHS